MCSRGATLGEDPSVPAKVPPMLRATSRCPPLGSLLDPTLGMDKVQQDSEEGWVQDMALATSSRQGPRLRSVRQHWLLRQPPRLQPRPVWWLYKNVSSKKSWEASMARWEDTNSFKGPMAFPLSVPPIMGAPRWGP